MQIVMYTGRPRPLFWAELVSMRSVIAGVPMHIVSGTCEQAERTFASTKALLNGRDPKATPG